MLAKPGEISLLDIDELSTIVGKSPGWTGEQLVEEISPIRRILKEQVDIEMSIGHMGSVRLSKL
jgi:hypothetical protein